MTLACAARDAGFDVHVACPVGNPAKHLAAEGFPFHAIPLDRCGVNPIHELATLASLIRVYKRVRPDLVHHLRLKPVLYGSLAARFTGVPTVVNLLTGLGYLFTSNSRAARLLRQLVMLACRVAFSHPNQRLVLQNPDDRDLLLRHGVLPVEKTLLINGSGVDTDRFSPRPEPVGPPVIMLASRMLWDKGVGEFIQAARILRDSGLKARFVLVGDTDAANPSAIPLVRLHEWNNSGVIEWWGPRADMSDALNQAHIVCLPSIREGLPRILAEAASCGRPLVATDAPGCREVVRNGDNGLLVPLRDSRSLARTLRLLVENAALRQAMGARSRERALREFSVSLVISQTLGLYSLLLGIGSSQGPASAPLSVLPGTTPPMVSYRLARQPAK